MQDTFALNIELGNDAMQDGSDVADALIDVADRLRAGGTSGSVIDDYGNTVGSWTLKIPATPGTVTRPS